jgi:hypothetical protein
MELFEPMFEVICKLIDCDYTSESVGDFRRLCDDSNIAKTLSLSGWNQMFYLIKEKQYVRRKWFVFKELSPVFPTSVSHIVCDYYY